MFTGGDISAETSAPPSPPRQASFTSSYTSPDSVGSHLGNLAEGLSSPASTPPRYHEEVTKAAHTLLSSSASLWRQTTLDESEDIVMKPLWQLSFVTSMAAGYSSIPIFALVITIACNVLYTRLIEWLVELQSHGSASHLMDYIVVTLHVLTLAFFVRNLLVACWDVLVDSLAEQPTLSPILLRNFRKIMRKCGRRMCGVQWLLLLFHLVCAVAVYWSVDAGVRFSLLSPSIHHRRWLFPANFLFKLLLLWVGPLLPCPTSKRPTMAEARRLYVGFSDAALYVYTVGPDLLGSQEEWFPSEMDAETERRALAFNLCILVIANLASYGFFTSRLLQMTRRTSSQGGSLPSVTYVDASEWDRIMVASRLLTVTVALNGWAVSALRTGLLPSLFSFTVLFAGISINRVLLFLLVETLRTWFAMQRSVWTLTCALEALVFGPALLAPFYPPPPSSPLSHPDPHQDTDRTSTRDSSHHDHPEAKSRAAPPGHFPTPEPPKPPPPPRHPMTRHCSRRGTWWASVGLLLALAAALVKVANAEEAGRLWPLLRVCGCLWVCLTYKYVVHAEKTARGPPQPPSSLSSFSGGGGRSGGRVGGFNSFSGPTGHPHHHQGGPTRRRSLSFFQHGLDYVVFLPLLSIVTFAIYNRVASARPFPAAGGAGAVGPLVLSNGPSANGYSSGGSGNGRPLHKGDGPTNEWAHDSSELRHTGLSGSSRGGNGGGGGGRGGTSPLFSITTSQDDHDATWHGDTASTSTSTSTSTSPLTTLNVSSIIGTMTLRLKARPISSDAPSSVPSSSSRPPPVEAKAKAPGPRVWRYGFCDSLQSGVGLLDYAFLSLLSYLEPDSREFDMLLHHYSTGSGSDWAPMYSSSSSVDSPTAAGFVEFFSPSHNLSVMAIRGTNPLHLFDVFQDTLLFHRAFTFELTAQLVPLLRWMPAVWTRHVLYLGHLPLELFSKAPPSTYYHTELISYVQTAVRDRPIVLTGHSLGGGIAKIVAAATGVPVVAVSSPGIYLSSKGFDVPAEPLAFLETNLISEGDLIPKIDILQGSTYKMRCSKTNPLHCHQPAQSICELVNGCGSDWIESCRFIT